MTNEPTTPTLWRDMTTEEKGALFTMDLIDGKPDCNGVKMEEMGK